MNHQRLGIANIGKQAEQPQRVDEALTSFEASANAEGDQRARAIREIFLGAPVILARWQPGIVHPLHVGMAGEKLRDLQRVLGMALQAKVQSLRALQQQESVKRRQAPTGVAQPLHARLDDESEIAERLGIRDAVIRRIRLDKVAEASRSFPVELAAVHDDTADGVTVAADKFGGGVNDDVSS